MDESTIDESFENKQPYKKQWLTAFKKKQNKRLTFYNNYYKPQIPATLRASTKNEVRSVDIPSTTTLIRTPATPPTGICLNATKIGTANFERIGSKFTMKNLHIRGQFQTATSVTSGPGLIRLVVVYDRQTNKQTPTFADLFQSVSNTGSKTNTISSEINVDNRDRFLILRDKQMEVPYIYWNANNLVASVPQTNPENYCINEFIKLKNLETVCVTGSNGGTYGDISTGGLFLFVFSDATDSSWNFVWQSRLRFYA